MFERLADLEIELGKLETRLSEIYASGDQSAVRDAGRRHAELRSIVDVYHSHKEAQSNLDEAQQLLASESDPEMRAFLEAEKATQEAEAERLEHELHVLLIPKDPNDARNVIVEVRGAEGGEEANLFAGDLFRMYQRYAERRGWKSEVLSSQPSDMRGFKEVTFVIKGDQAWSRLEHEAGTHRVQRVPVTESQGRIHTSAATVAVLPEAQEVDVHIDANDLEIDVFRSTGPGGQSVNTTDSAVRMTHKPTGLVVTCQDEKSQLQNRDKALRIMRARLLKLEQDRQSGEIAAARRAQVGGGGRSEKVRTYNFKENRITDHRVGVTLYKLEQALDGDIDEVIEALVMAKRTAQLAGESSGQG